MPVITLYWDELERLVGADRKTILENLPMIGCDIERVYEDHVDVEFFPNRPDLYSVEGVARALRGFLDIERGYKNYEVREGSWSILVDESVLPVRPYIRGCVVKGLEMTDEVIRSLMEVQEDLHWTIGRNRRRMAIGVHDLNKIKFPLRYKAVDKSFSFVPLDFDRVMTVEEILDEHPKGKMFSFILEGKEAYPMIVDADGDAISFPPIINAEKTRVTEETKDIFIDVTGFDEYVDKALNILATMLADRGGRIESVRVIYPNETYVSPDLSPKRMSVRKREIFDLLGFKLSDEDITVALERMRYGVESIDDESLSVLVPPYRADIMHEWDVIEDIAIGYRYDKIEPEYPKTVGIGVTHPWNDVRDAVRDVMVGLGFLEVITFTLTNEEIQYEYTRRKAEPWRDYVPLLHPITEEHTILRTDILPKLLEVLSVNKHHPMPQRIFEVGDVVVGMRNRLRLACCITHSRANFAEVRSVVQAVMRELDIKWDVDECDDEMFIEGRRAYVIVGGRKVGVFGEVHPEVLEKFGIQNPVVGFELDLTDVFNCGVLI